MAQDLMNGPLSDAIHLRDDFTLSLSQRLTVRLVFNVRVNSGF